MVLTAKGYVRTPKKIVQRMLSKLFELRTPTSNDKILDPGCGPGTFIEGIIDWCTQNNLALPKITGVELDTRYAKLAAGKFENHSEISIENKDFLTLNEDKFDFIIGNPPYVSITQLTNEAKNLYSSVCFITSDKRKFNSKNNYSEPSEDVSVEQFLTTLLNHVRASLDKLGIS